MIPRLITADLEKHLRQYPAVGLIGARQVGKTTLALEGRLEKKVRYFDLERLGRSATWYWRGLLSPLPVSK